MARSATDGVIFSGREAAPTGPMTSPPPSALSGGMPRPPDAESAASGAQCAPARAGATAMQAPAEPGGGCAGADAAAAAGSSSSVLNKPDRPDPPKQPDLRYVKDPIKRKAMWDAYLAECEAHKPVQEAYEAEYAVYRAAKKKTARPSDDGARAVQRRRANPAAADNHRRREGDARRGELQQSVVYDLEHSLSCGQSARPSDPIMTYHDWPGTDGLAHRRAWDRATLQGLVAWARAVPPDGSNEWWAHPWGVARIIDTKGTLGTIGFGFGSIQKPLFAAGGMPPPTPRASLRDEWVQIVQSAAAAPELAAAPSPAAAPAPAAASAPAPSAAGSSSDWWAAAIAEHARRREEGLERWRAYQVVREERERAALEQQRAASAAAPRTPRATRTINESYDPEDGVSFEAAAIPTPPSVASAQTYTWRDTAVDDEGSDDGQPLYDPGSYCW